MKTLIKLLVFALVISFVYLASYFFLMEEGIALHPKTKIPEYSSIPRFGSTIDAGPISLQVTHSSWLNPIYQPLDKLFRKKPTPPLKWEGFE
ncbi:MAG: hypothetical protein AAGI48_00305 [Verrucomicrobiota bacterium]